MWFHISVALKQCNTFVTLVKTKCAQRNHLLCTGNADFIQRQLILQSILNAVSISEVCILLIWAKQCIFLAFAQSDF